MIQEIQERNERLLRLAYILENFEQRKPASVGRFHLGYWMMTQEGCGTAACAVGTAMCDPWFNHLGLLRDGNTPAFDGFLGWNAVAKFFRISNEQAEHLFDVDTYVPCQGCCDSGCDAPIRCYQKRGGTIAPIMVADRIRALIGIPRHPEDPDSGEAIPMPTLQQETMQV